MSQYQPSPFTALAVYVFAAAHHLELAITDIEYPGMLNIEEVAPGNFLVTIPATDGAPGSFVICTYVSQDELWHVRLPDNTVLLVRDDGGEFTVVG